MSEPVKDIPDDKGPRGALNFLVETSAAVVLSLKNPGRRRGATEALRLAKVQLDAELGRLYAIERTARAFAADYAAHPRVDTGTPEEVEAFRGLTEALAITVPE